MNPEEVSSLSDQDALRAYAWLTDNRPQAARALMRMNDPRFRVSPAEVQLAGEAMLVCPGVGTLRQRYPQVQVDDGSGALLTGDAGDRDTAGPASDIPTEGTDGPSPGGRPS